MADYLKSCENCKNNDYMQNTGPCETCWKFNNWQQKHGDENNYFWPWLPEEKKNSGMQTPI